MDQNNNSKTKCAGDRYPALRTWIVVAAVGLFLVLAWLAAAPSTGTIPTASAFTAKAAPTPPLDKDAADALVELLKASLADSIEDEEAIASIQRKWDARIVANRTRKQILDLLFADVKSIVSDKETQDAVWESWKEIGADAEAAEPEPAPNVPEPAPRPPTAVNFDAPTEMGIVVPRVAGAPWVLTDDLKRSNAGSEMAFFRNAYNAVKVWRPEPRQYRGQSYTIYLAMDPLDPNLQGKVVGIEKAVKTVIDNGFNLPRDLRIYCSGVVGTLTQAFKRGDNWAPIAYIVLGDGGSTKALSATSAGFNGFETRAIRTIHEIGHILHERDAGDGFWEKGRFAPTAVSGKVSQYAQGNEKEFVAETYTGLMIGKQWPADVMAEYRKFRGPFRP